MEAFKIFIVEDDELFSRMLRYHLSLNPDFEVEVFHNGKDCLNNLYKNPSVVTLDFYMPGMKGSEVLTKIKEFNPDLPVIIVSGQQEVKTAVDLLKMGAYDYVIKDDDTKERLWNILAHLLNHRSLVNKVNRLEEEVIKKYKYEDTIIGKSDAIKKVFSLIDKAVRNNFVVSITGETGTGKEMIAKAIHYNSSRSTKSFVAINVAAVPRELIESELFGHEKGAFTGAINKRIGKFEEAQGGTIFLDEIGEMDLSMQTKLLRVLQEQEVTRVGSNETIKLDVRVIVATHRNLMDEVKKGNFREDLYYRLLGIPISLPPLRDRKEDILLLANHFIKSYCKENKVQEKKLSPEAISKIKNYKFPGNVRELKALVELGVVMSDQQFINEDDIQTASASFLDELLSEELSLDEYNKLILKYYLKKYKNKVRLVASKLGIGKSTIYSLLKEDNLSGLLQED